MKDPHPTARDAPFSTQAPEYRGSLPVERREEAWEWGMESATNILIRGKVAEALDKLMAAFHQYDAALRVAEFFDQPSETGEIHYGIGRCSSRLGDPNRGFEAYIAAARMFSAYGASQGSPHRLSEALGEAGMLLVVSGPYIRNDCSADEHLLGHGLDDATRHAIEVLLGEGPPTRAGLTTIHRKLTGLLVLAACASASPILLRARQCIETSILVPFLKRYGEMPACLVALARLFAAIGEQEKSERVGIPTTESEVRALVVEVYRSFDEVERPMMMRWLSSYLRADRGVRWLIQEAIESAISEF